MKAGAERGKAALLTWCYNNGRTNYGQILQCYAMQTVIRRLGYDTRLIRYRRRMPEERPCGGGASGLGEDLYELRHRLKTVEGKADIRILRFIRFIRRHISLSRQCYTKEQVEAECRDCGVLFCGSDQIWNPAAFDSIYALDFGRDDQKRIAYAPSGVLAEDGQAEAVYREIGRCLERFGWVSVRERAGAEILRRYTEKPVHVAADPTLLLSAEDWGRVAAGRRMAEPYVFYYSLGRLRPGKPLVKRVMEKHGARKILFLTSGLYEGEARQESGGCFVSADTAGPAEFLALIRDAEAVCTDSFHGLALSLVFRKQFYLLERKKEPGTAAWASGLRQESLLEQAGIRGGRTVRNRGDVDRLGPVDYSEVRTEGYWEEVRGQLLGVLDDRERGGGQDA